MARHLSAEIDSSFERRLTVENALVASAKSAIGEQLGESDKASLLEIIRLFDSLLQGEEELRSPSLTAVSIDMAHVARRVGGIFNTRFKLSQFMDVVTSLKLTASDILANARVSRERRQAFEEFLNVLSESEGKEIERLQSQPLGSYSVA